MHILPGRGVFMLGSGWRWRGWIFELNWCLRESCSWLRNCRRVGEGVIRMLPLAYACGRHRQRALFVSEESREFTRTICLSTTWSCNNCESYDSNSEVWLSWVFLRTSINPPKVSDPQQIRARHGVTLPGLRLISWPNVVSYVIWKLGLCLSSWHR